MPVHVDAVLLETSRMSVLSDFYRKGFELEEPDTAESDQMGFQIGDFYLGLEQVAETDPPSATMSIWFKVDDARTVYERLLQLGATSKAAPEEVEDEVIASVFDPDGNVIGLLSEIT